MGSDYRLAIDYGAAETAAATIAPGEPARPLDLAGHPTLPSAIAISRGSLVAGPQAADILSSRPDKEIPSAKRRLGTSDPLVRAPREVSPEEGAAATLAIVVREAMDRYDRAQPADVVVACDPGITDAGARALEAAVRLAGVSPEVPVALVHDDIAAASRLAGATAPGSLVAVLDLGVGCRLSVLTRTADGFTRTRGPVQPGGIGGDTFDELLADHLAARLDPETAAAVRDPAAHGGAARSAFTAAIEAAKRLAAEGPSAALVANPTPGGEPVPLSRLTLETVLAPALLGAVDALEALVRDAGGSPSSVAAVVVTGGSSQLARIDELLAERFGRIVAEPGHRKLAVALGAASGIVAATPAAAPAPAQATVPASAGTELAPEAHPEPAPPPEPAAGAGETVAAAAAADVIDEPTPVAPPAGPAVPVPPAGPAVPVPPPAWGQGMAVAPRPPEPRPPGPQVTPADRVPGVMLIAGGVVVLVTLLAQWTSFDEIIYIYIENPFATVYPFTLALLAAITVVGLGLAWAISGRARRPDALLGLTSAAALVVSPLGLTAVSGFEFDEVAPFWIAGLAGVVAIIGAAMEAYWTRLWRRWPAIVVAAAALLGMTGRAWSLASDSSNQYLFEYLEPSLPVKEVLTLVVLGLVPAAVLMAANPGARRAGRYLAIGLSVGILIALALTLVRLVLDEDARYFELAPAPAFFWLLAGAAVGLAGGIADHALSRRTDAGGGGGVEARHPAAPGPPSQRPAAADGWQELPGRQ